MCQLSAEQDEEEWQEREDGKSLGRGDAGARRPSVGRGDATRRPATRRFDEATLGAPPVFKVTVRWEPVGKWPSGQEVFSSMFTVASGAGPSTQGTQRCTCDGGPSPTAESSAIEPRGKRSRLQSVAVASSSSEMEAKTVPVVAFRVLVFWLCLAGRAAKFYLGKVPPAEFDMVDLNGAYRPEEAVVACEADPICAGFTYRGLLNTTAVDPEMKFETFFFRFVHIVLDEDIHANWVTYLSEKPYGTYHGIFEASEFVEVDRGALLGTRSFRDECENKKCAGLVVDSKSLRIKGVMKRKVDGKPSGNPDVRVTICAFPPALFGPLDRLNLNLTANFVKHPSLKTLINFDADSRMIDNTQPRIDYCCPAHTHDDVPVEKWLQLVNDTLPRISCNDITPAEFATQYIEPRVPVILTDCLDSWAKDILDWTIEGVLETFHNHTWFAQVIPRDFIGRDDYSPKQVFGDIVTYDEDEDETDELGRNLYDEDDEESEEFMGMDEEAAYQAAMKDAKHNILNSTQILSMLKFSNVSLRLFDRVAVAPRRKRVVSSITSDKRDILRRWSWPKAIPHDLYGPSFGGSDYAWMIMGTKYTGTKCHQDPELTDAWNAIIQGHKYWVLFPKDVDVEQFNCDPECSELPNEDEVFSLPWYSHVLPQLRSPQALRYGIQPIEVVQRPGEIIYVPSWLGHVVMNLDDTVSVTENFLGSRAVKDELPVFQALKLNPFPFNSENATERVWRNLMNRDLRDDVQLRRYAREMLKQVSAHVALRHDVRNL